jgi:hypothetical protein
MFRKTAPLWKSSYRPAIEQLENRELLNATPEQLVTRFYGDLLQRQPDTGGLAYWTKQLQVSGNAANVVSGIEATTEFLARYVDQRFEALLGRSADSQAKEYFVHFLQARPSATDLDRALLTTPEFTLHAGITDDASFVDAAYRSILHRAADADGRNYFLTQLMNHAGRTSVLNSMLGSEEFARNTVNGFYEQFLGRNGTNQEEAVWIDQLKQTGNVFFVAAGILGSAEYASEQLHASRQEATAPDTPSAFLTTGGWKPYVRGDTFVEADFAVDGVEYTELVSATIWWGDGATATVSGEGEESGDPSIALSQTFHHQYAVAGHYTVTVMGFFYGPSEGDPYYFYTSLDVGEIPPDYPVNSQCAGDLIATNPMDTGEAVKDSTDNPVRYNDGVAQITGFDLSSNGFGAPWGKRAAGRTTPLTRCTPSTATAGSTLSSPIFYLSTAAVLYVW